MGATEATITFWLEDSLFKRTDLWSDTLNEYLASDTKDPSFGFVTKVAPHRRFNNELLDAVSQEVLAKKPNISIIALGTSDILDALSNGEVEDLFDHTATLLKRFVSLYKANPKHGVLFLGAFPLELPPEMKIDQNTYDTTAYRYNSLLLQATVGLKEWNIAAVSPCSFFCIESEGIRVLADNIFEAGSIALTKQAMKHFLDSTQIHARLLNNSRKKGLHLLEQLHSCRRESADYRPPTPPPEGAC